MTREERIAKVVKMTDDGCVPYYDVLPSLIRERSYKNGIEIGVLFGGHAEAMLRVNSLQLLVGIDPYEMYEQAESMKLMDQEDFDYVYNLTLERLSDDRYLHFRATSDMAFPHIQDMGSLFNFVFIDGLHTYEQVKRDLSNYSQLIRIGGVIACHDYNHPSYPALTTAIDEFAAEHNTEIVICPFHAVYMNKTW